MRLSSEPAATAQPNSHPAPNTVVPLHDGEVMMVCAPIAYAATWPVTWLDLRERQRLTAYRFAADRRRHHAAHALKRWVIGQLVNQPPQRLAFTVDGRGKPRLVEPALHFNLSHSGGWVAMALRQNAEVGIDVEQARLPAASLSWPTIRHPDESELPDTASFLKTWTLKEAVSKCCGEGLMLEFTRLRLRPDTQTDFRCDDGQRHWHAWHGMLDVDTHLAIASTSAWSRLRWLQVACDYSLSQRSATRLAGQCAELLAKSIAEMADVAVAQ